MRKYLTGFLSGVLITTVIYVVDRQPIETAGGRQTNLLIADGFKVYDPEGYLIDHFDE